MSAKQNTDFSAPGASLCESAAAWKLIQRFEKLSNEYSITWNFDRMAEEYFDRSRFENLMQMVNDRSYLALICLCQDDQGIYGMSADYLLTSDVGRQLFVDEMMDRFQAKKPSPSVLEEADTETHIRRVSDQTITSLNGIEDVLLQPVLESLGVWADLSRAADPRTNDAWLIVAMRVAKAFAIHNSGLRTSDLPAAAFGAPVHAIAKFRSAPAKTKKSVRGRPEGQTETTREKMLVARALVIAGFKVKDALSIAKLSPGTWYYQPYQD